ncbi:MAG TPA: alpha-N-acetylglucosaminidase [Chitinophagaceae bacterium]|nr:alpha-N-acetylglucosaminidase [Chitinophagaceae bacterium]
MSVKKIAGFIIAIFFAYTAAGQNRLAAANALVKRIMKDKASQFVTELIPRDNGKDVYELESKNGKIILRGSTGVSISSALNYYLEKYCHCLITWNGVNMNLPQKLPAVQIKIHTVTPYKYRYYLNYCTFNYSMAWWDWDRWQREIDWMALNGINMPLALTGEEAIWQDVYKSMGFTDTELDRFFSGPSYFAWLWMGNLDAWGGPLPQHWKDAHKELQKKILGAERALGMTPVLPAFTGHVPPSFKNRFPAAKVKHTNWNSNFADVYILDPSDSMFEVIGKKFLLAEQKEFGTDHLYSADTFNENVPPTTDSSYLDKMSKKVYASMALADPKAVWVMQGWMFHYNSAYWKPTQIQALLNAVPDDNMIILDLYSESFPVWKQTNAYYGKPWIWCMLNNFGGNITLWGRMENAAADPAAALHSASSGKMEGIGLAPEAIEQNPALYQLMMQNVWQDTAINTRQWLKQYAVYRYGFANDSINKAWDILRRSVYEGGLTEGGPESIISARPTFDSSAPWVNTRLSYNPAQLVQAWRLFVQSAHQLKNSDGFQYDLVDITRQVLANYATPLQQKFALAYKQKDTAAFNKYSNQFLQLMDDMEKLLSTRKDFLLGKWIADARANGITESEKNIYEFNARDLITLWGNKDCSLHEYSTRQWAGVINGFYKPRWEMFFMGVKQAMKEGIDFDFASFNTSVENWEWKWANSHDEQYAARAQGNPVAIAMQLYNKYRPLISY